MCIREAESLKLEKSDYTEKFKEEVGKATLNILTAK